MLNRIRDRFGTAGLVVSIMALVLALAGGAFAASGGLTAKQKKQVKAIAKSFQGTGPAGPAGPQGPAGVDGRDGANGRDGADGTNGTNGTDGTDGKTVLNGFGAPNNTVGTNGDFYIDTDSQTIYGPKAGGLWPTPGTPLRGANGSPWTMGGTLPVGATEKGAWSMLIDASGSGITSISFTVPLAAEIAGANTHLVTDGGAVPAACDDGVAPAVGIANPEADSGHLCVWQPNGFGNPSPDITKAYGLDPGAARTGAMLIKFGGTPGPGFGTWAVTG